MTGNEKQVIEEPVFSVEIKYPLDPNESDHGAGGADPSAVLRVITEFFSTKKECELTFFTKNTETTFTRHKGEIISIFRKVKLIPT